MKYLVEKIVYTLLVGGVAFWLGFSVPHYIPMSIIIIAIASVLN